MILKYLLRIFCFSELLFHCWPQRQWKIQRHWCYVVCIWLPLKNDSNKESFSIDTQLWKPSKCPELHSVSAFSENNWFGKLHDKLHFKQLDCGSSLKRKSLEITYFFHPKDPRWPWHCKELLSKAGLNVTTYRLGNQYDGIWFNGSSFSHLVSLVTKKFNWFS